MVYVDPAGDNVVPGLVLVRGVRDGEVHRQVVGLFRLHPVHGRSIVTCDKELVIFVVGQLVVWVIVLLLMI